MAHWPASLMPQRPLDPEHSAAGHGQCLHRGVGAFPGSDWDQSISSSANFDSGQCPKSQIDAGRIHRSAAPIGINPNGISSVRSVAVIQRIPRKARCGTSVTQRPIKGIRACSSEPNPCGIEYRAPAGAGRNAGTGSPIYSMGECEVAAATVLSPNCRRIKTTGSAQMNPPL